MNDSSKSIFASVTFWGILIGVLSQFASRAGYHVPDDTAGIANDVASLAGAAMALWGRVRAAQLVHVISPPSGNQGGFASVRLLIVLALAALVIACATTPQTPQQSVYAAKGAYTSALSVAVAYKELPSCADVHNDGTPRPALCADRAVVAKIQAADDCAFAVISLAEGVARGSGMQPVPPASCLDPTVSAAIQAAGTSLPALIGAANQAVNLFTSITATLKLN